MVTLARSVAHLSSEMRSQNTLYNEVEEVKREIDELKKARSAKPYGPGNPDFDRFRAWVPALTNPKRVNKLTRSVLSLGFYYNLHCLYTSRMVPFMTDHPLCTLKVFFAKRWPLRRGWSLKEGPQ